MPVSELQNVSNTVFKTLRCLVVSTANHRFLLSLYMPVAVMFENFPFRQCHQRGAVEGDPEKSGQSIFEGKEEEAHIHFNASTFKAFQGGV